MFIISALLGPPPPKSPKKEAAMGSKPPITPVALPYFVFAKVEPAIVPKAVPTPVIILPAVARSRVGELSYSVV